MHRLDTFAIFLDICALAALRTRDGDTEDLFDGELELLNATATHFENYELAAYDNTFGGNHCS